MANIDDIMKRFSGKGVYPHQLAWLLLLPFRNLYLSPKTLVKRLELKENMKVLELGCGPGYFSPTIAKAIPLGKLYLADIQPEMIQKAKLRLAKKDILNAEFFICDGNSLPFENNFFDRIFLVTVLGEIANIETYLIDLYRILKSGGFISISEQGGDPDSLTLEEVKELLLPKGFVFEKIFGKGKTFTANFRKP